jgi:hypothetical protein
MKLNYSSKNFAYELDASDAEIMPFPGNCKYVITIIESIVFVSNPEDINLKLFAKRSSLFPLYSSNPCILIRILFFSKYSPGQPI